MLRANRDRIDQRIAELADLTTSPPFTRRAFTDVYLRGREWVQHQMKQAGLQVHLDEGANLIGSRAGQRHGSWMLGSHTDTVPAGGRFDGIAGVISALEVAQVLSEHGHQLQHGLDIVDFLSEEPSDYGASCVGSRAMAGTLTRSMLEGTNSRGETLAQAVQRMGGQPDRLDRALRQSGTTLGFLELHIEQGPVLERSYIDLGIVEGIVAIERHRVIINGQADHAGTTPMSLRKDALVAAAAVVQYIQQQAVRENEQRHFVSTVGKLRVEPNASNVVPSMVELVFEARCMDDKAVHLFCRRVTEAVHGYCNLHGLTCTTERVSFAGNACSDPRLLGALIKSTTALGYSCQRMPSGAGHDAMQIANFAPVAMLFVPCRGGKSHMAEEYASTEHIARGTDVLIHALTHLDAQFSNT